jgi:hypothetical protein
MQQNEDVISYTVEFSLGTIFALVGVFDEDHEVISHRSVNLGPEGFALLMSANPEWSPMKPEGNFRKEDLITVINMLEQK